MDTLRHTAIRSEGPSISDRAPGSTVSFYANREEAKKIVALLAVSAFPGTPTEKRRQRRSLRSLRSTVEIARRR